MSDQDTGPGEPATGRRTASAVTSAAILLAALDAYVVVTIMVDVMRDMSIPVHRPERATPIVTAYLLGYVAAMPLLGQLSDRVGRSRVIQGCLAAFAIGSAVSAAAPSLGILVAGRLVQGAAGGALLPVTYAVISDLWAVRSRAVPLGVAGAAQEIGSVLGPLYGAGLAAWLGWRGVFWINLPLAAAAIAAVRRGLPDNRAPGTARVDLGGGLLLAVALGAAIVGLYNPEGSEGALPPWGPAALAVAGAGLVAFVLWERRSPTRLIDFSSVDSRPVLAALTCSFLSGAALMATLVDIPLLAQTLLEEDTLGAALVLSRFLAALAGGALAGGWLSRRFGERSVAFWGLQISAWAFWLIARWPLDVEATSYGIAGLRLPRMDADLMLAGVGLGLIIAPLASAVLRSSSPEQHGAVSAGLVVTRMMGMLIGIAALGSFGVWRFGQLTRDLVPPLPFGVEPAVFDRQVAAYETAVRRALHAEYGEIFAITAALCALGAFAALGLRGQGQAGNGEQPAEAS